MYDILHELLSFKKYSPSYPLFLHEQLILFLLAKIEENKLYEMTTTMTFLETFNHSNFVEKNLLCELCL